MRRTRTTRTRTKLEIRNPRHKSAFSFSENEMMSFGVFASSSSSSSLSSNLSPLAPPFTVERSNHNKFNLGTNVVDSHFNFKGNSDGVGFWSSSPNFQSSTTSQGLSADSIRTATVPSTYSTFPNPNPNPNPITITTPSTHNRSSSSAVNLSAIGSNQHVIDASFSTFASPITTSSTHSRSSVPVVNLSAIGPNQRVMDASFSSYSSPFSASSTHNWSSMNSSIKSGLEPVNPPAGHVFGVNPNTQPHKWSLGNDVSDNDAQLMPLEFSLLPSRNIFQDYGSSQVSYSQSLSGLKYGGQADGSRGKEDSSLFGPMFSRPVARENNIGPSVIGVSHGTPSSPATCHGLVSSGFSNEYTLTWNDYTSHYPFETSSFLYDSSSDHQSPSMTTKSQDISSTSLFNKNTLSVSHNPLKENESYQAVGFEYKSSLNSQVPDINSAEEVNSAAHVSEHLDHHNPGEDSPCWKGAPTHFSSSGSQEQESSQHPRKKLQNNSASGEDVLLHMDQSLHGTDENVVTSESLDVNMVVKALNNLSELLLRQYSKDEYRLKEQDHKALDHVIANLKVCMSGKIQEVNPAQKCSPPQEITSNELREEWNNDEYGKNIEELQSAYVRDEGLPKDYSMVQKIKRVLDENLEFKEDLPSDPLLYKNLWLEAEAELCVSSYKARLHRAKREMGKSKALDLSEVASDIKKISSSNFSSITPEMLHEAAGRKTSNTHAPNISLPIVDDIDDVDNSVMSRFKILKRREESSPVNMAEKEPADVEASGNKNQSSGVAEESHLRHLLDRDDEVVMHSHGNQKMQGPFATEDVDNAVMARMNILKSRGEPDPVHTQVAVVMHSHGNQKMPGPLATEDVDNAVMARMNILKSRGELDPVNAQASEEGLGTSMTQNQFGSLSAYNASSFGWEYVMEG